MGAGRTEYLAVAMTAIRAALALSLMLVVPTLLPGQQGDRIDAEFRDLELRRGWELTGDTEIAEVDGRPALLLRNGTAVRRDVRFEDGVIEFEYRGTDERAFLGVAFRVGPDGTAEDLYLRLHKAKQPDAVQYAPRYRGFSQWQLFHGPGATAFLAHEPDVWTKVRIDVAGDRAMLTVGEASQPQLVVGSLESGRTDGRLELWAVQPGAGPDQPWTAAVRDVRVAAGSPRPIPAGEPLREVDGAIRAWGVSTGFSREGTETLAIPEAVASRPWRAIGARVDGLLFLDSVVDRPSRDGIPTVLAGLAIESDRDRIVRLDLGFSDDASVFLNGRLLYLGRHSFSTNFPRRQGLITLDQASLFLDLEPGRNSLVVAVSETYGGWAIMGRIADRAGITVRPMSDPVPSGRESGR